MEIIKLKRHWIRDEAVKTHRAKRILPAIGKLEIWASNFEKKLRENLRKNFERENYERELVRELEREFEKT